ncbi:hypothetical protein L2750_11950 [Shewanella submarina]|uniref:Uncharacterized protein n=1 Tax=Shewanella submarina TaxID=2016376 RepID=A0ABV7GFC4_9GAMM|nr:hypothetical protein [Shewanella submarina]MCL1037865.1 hypothetical protein [Shewanella submarina]
MSKLNQFMEALATNAPLMQAYHLYPESTIKQFGICEAEISALTAFSDQQADDKDGDDETFGVYVFVHWPGRNSGITTPL